jgi:signal transduction histidine kinase
MGNLIDGILQYSRVGRVREAPVEVKVDEVLRDVIDFIAPSPNVTITVENTLPSIVIEPTRIQQIFQNLLSNAIKYMDKPQCEIRIGCIAEGEHWRFSISDNGPGIESRHFEKIFQLFQTLAPRDRVESTGVGLTLVKKIVEMYGGNIWVESTPGEGTTFFFTLPKTVAIANSTKGTAA